MIDEIKRKYLQLAEKHGTPLYVYDSAEIKLVADMLLNANLPFGHTVRYAAKANPHQQIIESFHQMGLHFDASSAYEALHLVRSGVEPSRISLSSQTLEGPIKELLESGVKPVATSQHQLEQFHEIGVKELATRINPGKGSGHNNRTNTGGIASSFGIWHEQLPDIKAAADKWGIKINRLHTHIGSGADPKIWEKVIGLSLEIVEKLPDVVTLDIGGGYKVARTGDESPTDMKQVLNTFGKALEEFADRTGRKIHLEIEPGTLLVANAGTLLAKVMDIVSTGENGYTFLKLNTGMNDILRPSIYGAQHPIRVLNSSKTEKEYVVVGHNCESGDILTPAPGDPEGILPRKLAEAQIGDIVAIGGAGAYCASMSAKGYNSFPSAKEIVI